MVKRGAVIGIGFFLLGVGLTSLVLMKMEGVYRPASKGQPDLHDVKPPAPSQQEPGTQPGFELRPLPVTPDSIKQTPEPGSQTVQSPAPQSVEEPKNPPLAETKSQPRPSPEALPPVVIRFRFDPAQQREINVAQVHLGDSISVRAAAGASEPGAPSRFRSSGYSGDRRLAPVEHRGPTCGRCPDP